MQKLAQLARVSTSGAIRTDSVAPALQPVTETPEATPLAPAVMQLLKKLYKTVYFAQV